jgi:hypothetical protein
MNFTRICEGVIGGLVVLLLAYLLKRWRDRQESRPIHPHVAGGSMGNETDEQRQVCHEIKMVESDDPEIWKPQK